MNSRHIVFAIILAGVAASFADWFFSGFLFHDKYGAYPEIWRRPSGVGESKAIAWSTLLGFVMCTAFVLATQIFAIHGYARAFAFAGMIWLIVALPLLITNALYIKMHPLVVVGHSLGWLARLMIAGAAVGWLLA